MEYIPIPAIAVLCFVCTEAVKALGIDHKWLPTICGLVGGILGAFGLYTMPDYPMHDTLNAIALGVVSGLSATGAHQIYKQLNNRRD